MEQSINFHEIGEYINPLYLFTFMLLGYLIKHYLKENIDIFFKKNIKFVFIILILAIIVAIPFLIAGESWQKILFSYAIGTSLHEVVFTFIEKKIQAFLNN